MVKAQPRRPAWAFILLGLLLVLWAYPIVVGWWTLDFRESGALTFMFGDVLFLVFAIVERRTVFPTLFGAQRSKPNQGLECAPRKPSRAGSAAND